MASITIDVLSDKINDIKLDKNRYYLEIHNNYDIEKVCEAFVTIIKNNVSHDVTSKRESYGRFYDMKKYYTTESSCGYVSYAIQLKESSKWREIQFANLYKINSGYSYWSRDALTDTRFNNDLVIASDKKDFRFTVSNTCKFPITKFLKDLVNKKHERDDRIRENNVKKFCGELSWIATMNDFFEHGYNNVGLTASTSNPLEYWGSLKTGRRLCITLRKDSVESDPRFDIWVVKGWLGKNVDKEGMVKFVESLIDMGLVNNASKNS